MEPCTLLAIRSRPKAPVPSIVQRGIQLIRFAYLALLLAASQVWSDTTSPGAPEAALADATTPPVAASSAFLPAEERAELKSFNRTVFVFRSSFLGIAPAQRARAAQERVDAMLDESGPIVATVEKVPQGAIVRLNGVFAFVVTPGDTDPETGESAVDAGQRAVRILGTVIDETREIRNVRVMLRSVAQATAATALFVALAWGLRRARRALTTRLSERAASRAERMQVRGVAIVQRDLALRLVGRFVAVIYWALMCMAVYEWFGFVLSTFPYTRPWGEQLTAFLLGTARNMVGATVTAVPGLAVALAIFVIARAAVRATHGFFGRVQSGRMEVGWLDADTVRPTQQLVTILVWLFAFVMAYPYLPGSDTEAFKGVSVLVGLMVSLGASSVIAQGASGLILMYTKTLRPGEFVRIGEHEGTVVELGMFTTRIRTGLGEELTLPSAVVLGAVTTNYSRASKGDGFVLDVSLTIGYDAPWRQVHALLVEAARTTPGVVQDPAPRVFQTSLSDFYVCYRLVCLASPREPRPRAEVISVLNARILDVFNAHGVQIMSPHYFGDPSEPKVVTRDRWYAAPAKEQTDE
jgi:small-conductance mechanosensitive channel